MTVGRKPVCYECKHFHGPWTCDAFGLRIPEEIAFEGLPHLTPYPGDHGIRFEPKEQPKPPA